MSVANTTLLMLETVEVSSKDTYELNYCPLDIRAGEKNLQWGR